MNVDIGRYRGLPIYWKSENEKCVIVYDQWAMMGKFKLYLNGNYTDSSDFMGTLIDLAKKSYYYRKDAR